jgi:hypothetical protein
MKAAAKTMKAEGRSARQKKIERRVLTPTEAFLIRDRAAHLGAQK